MKISSVKFNNFKPYFGENEVDLLPTDDKNLIIIGGRNGQGKTSFLVGVVWCLYGSNIEKVDEIYRNEVKGNYNKFRSKALNWKAKENNESQFSVEINFVDVELSDVFTTKDQKTAQVKLIRSYNVDSGIETFDILMDGQKNELLNNEDDRPIFVNDYLIPLDIAKFVFFDAEKITEIAQLGAKAQATLMDEAFGQVLGLNTYENLIEELDQYCKNLKKGEASGVIDLEINTNEDAKKMRENEIKINYNKLNEIEEEIEQCDSNIREITGQLFNRGDINVKINIEELRKQEVLLNEKLDEAKNKFNEINELVPFAIMGFKLEELTDHLQQEETIKRNSIEKEGLEKKTKEFAENLFNKPPFPEDDLDMPQKSFYYTKTKSLLADLIKQEDKSTEVSFYHELDKSEINQINTVFDLTKQSSKNAFEGIFNEYMRQQNDFQELTKKINQANASSQDEFIQDLQDQKKQAEKERDKLIEEKGKLNNDNNRKENEITSLQVKINNLLEKVSTSKQKEKEIKEVKKYINTLIDFVNTQKKNKKNKIQQALLKEINFLLEKKELVNEVQLNILNNKLGLEVKLFNGSDAATNPSTDMRFMLQA